MQEPSRNAFLTPGVSDEIDWFPKSGISNELYALSGLLEPKTKILVELISAGITYEVAEANARIGPEIPSFLLKLNKY